MNVKQIKKQILYYKNEFFHTLKNSGKYIVLFGVCVGVLVGANADLLMANTFGTTSKARNVTTGECAIYPSNSLPDGWILDSSCPDNSSVVTQAIFQGVGIGGGAALVEERVGDLGIIEGNSIVDTIVLILQIIMWLAGVAAFAAFVWAGFLYIFAFSNEENTEKARKAMIYAAVGIVVILLSWVIVQTIATLNFT